MRIDGLWYQPLEHAKYPSMQHPIIIVFLAVFAVRFYTARTRLRVKAMNIDYAELLIYVVSTAKHLLPWKRFLGLLDQMVVVHLSR